MKSPAGPTAATCLDESSRLLLWHVNGTLEGEEAARVRAHVEQCAVCSQEVAILAAMTREIGDSGVPTLGNGQGREPSAPRSAAIIRLLPRLAAVFLLASLLGIGWYALRSPHGDLPREAAGDRTARVSIDLGAGPSRAGGESPVLDLPRNAGRVEISFLVPFSSGSSFSGELRGPGGRLLEAIARMDGLDVNGRYVWTARADLFATEGDYEIRLLERSPEGQPREYLFPFRVMERKP